jgi:predicted MFS family arabinose efflux permease
MARRFRRDAAILFPAVGAQLIASTGIFIVPFIVAALMAAGAFDEQSAGFLISMEATAASLTTIGLSAWMQARSRRRWALIGAVLVIAGNAVSLISLDMPMLAAARLAAGIGAGIVTAEVAAVVARGLDRERLISGLTIAAVLNGSLWIYAIPNAPEELGYRAPYLALLVTCLIGAALLTRLPSPPVRRAAAQTPGSAPVRSSPLAFAVLPAIFLTQLGQGSFWTLVAIYGSSAGLTEEAIGTFLSLATLLLLVGVIGTAAAGTSLGRFAPLFVLTVINMASIVAITYAPDPTVYVAANVVQAITNLSSLVYQLGLAAAVDRSGRLFAAANGLVGLGNGLGAAVAGAVAVKFGAPQVGLAVVVFNVAALALFALVGAGIARRWVAVRA